MCFQTVVYLIFVCKTHLTDRVNFSVLILINSFARSSSCLRDLRTWRTWHDNAPGKMMTCLRCPLIFAGCRWYVNRYGVGPWQIRAVFRPFLNVLFVEWRRTRGCSPLISESTAISTVKALALQWYRRSWCTRWRVLRALFARSHDHKLFRYIMIVLLFSQAHWKCNKTISCPASKGC